MTDSPLAGARIILTGTRKAEETADFVRRLGGIPLVAPSLATIALDRPNDADRDPAAIADSPATGPAAELARILGEDVALVIFLTGVGARSLFQLAEARGTMAQLRALLDRATVVARGPKAIGALKGSGIRVDWVPPEATVEAIAAGLDRFDVAGRAAVVQLSGFADDRLATQLAQRGARVIELDLYRHVAPADAAPVILAIDAVCVGNADFLTFTSAIGAREFFAVAERFGRDDALIAALRGGRAIAVAVGTVTAAAIEEQGVPVGIVPTTHTTGGMLRAIGQWLASHPPSS